MRLKGWRIVDRNVQTPRGEIDLIARRGKTIAFVEVKSRPTIAEARRYLEQRTLARVIDAAKVLAPAYAAQGFDPRLDAILWAPWSRPRHLENLWLGW